MPNSILEGDLVVKGSTTIQGSFYPPVQCISDQHVSADPSKIIDADKLEHQFPMLTVNQQTGSAIVAGTYGVHIARADGELASFEASIDVIASDVSRTVTVDLKKSTAGGAYATVLSSPIVFNTSSTVRTAVAATIASGTYLDGDIFQVTVAVAGGAGSQAQGLTVTTFTQEEPA